MKALQAFFLFPLAFLLHHANRAEKSNTYYRIKSRILARHGQVSGEDIQKIEGKPCYYCHYHEEGECHHCDGTGWYKSPFYSLLQRVSFSGYVFHQPVRKIYNLSEGAALAAQKKVPVIEGYITHTPTRLSNLSLQILYLVYEPKYFYQWYLWKETGRGYWPEQPFALNHLWVNALHLLRYGINAPLLKEVKKIRAQEKHRAEADSLRVLAYANYHPFPANHEPGDDDLPF